MALELTDLSQIPANLQNGAVAVGNFDGVHIGHAALIAELVRLARQIGGPAVLVTFDPPPIAILRPDVPLIAPLSSISKRAELVGNLGVDALIALPTDQELLSLGPEEFFEKIILGKLKAKAMVEGPNFRFGKNRQGDTKALAGLCADNGLALAILEPKHDPPGEMVSSTRIRKLLSAGNVEQVNRFLTRPYAIEGRVGDGMKRGREIGFPTANLEECRNLLPLAGVYAGEVDIDGETYAAAINIGSNPTFGDEAQKFEVHVIGWTGDVYGRELEARLLKRIRDVIKFKSVDQLKEQLVRDIQECEAAFRQSG